MTAVMLFHRAALFGLILAALAGCASPPVVLNESPEGLVVRYNPNGTSAEEATALAQKTCDKYGRKAVFKASGFTGDTFATYSCVK
ncbi:MAG TPA: hypothetical protein VJR47_21790 [Stellaceae bacterium]|nr:hypothetical protein [Stellaceae bacterium]